MDRHDVDPADTNRASGRAVGLKRIVMMRLCCSNADTASTIGKRSTAQLPAEADDPPSGIRERPQRERSMDYVETAE